jgi:hypothetical protein
VLVGGESYFYPVDTIGEEFKVPVSGRNVTVEVLSSTPRLVLIKGEYIVPKHHFLPFSCANLDRCAHETDAETFSGACLERTGNRPAKVYTYCVCEVVKV